MMMSFVLFKLLNTIYCKCVRAGQFIAAEWELTAGYQYATINQNGRIDINSGVQNK
jgi:hypothetical protein